MIPTTRPNCPWLHVLVILVTLLVTAPPASPQSAGPDAPRFSASAEALLWWLKDSPAAPPLLSTGQLGDADYSAVFGGRPYDTGPHPGARFSVGYRLTPEWKVEGVGFFLPTTSVTRTVRSSGAGGSVRLVAPAFFVDESREGRLTIANPGDFAGDARESLTTSMHGAELNVTRRVLAGTGWRVEALGGFRYLSLRERLSFSADSVALDVADVFQPKDAFETTNRFYGVQAGVTGEYGRGPWFAQATAKVAVGAMRESLDIAGSLVTNDFNDFGAPQTFAGGIFAQPSNIGRHDRDRFAVVPEVGLKVGYRLTPWASVFVGYTFLYASAVVRPGPQVDRNINRTQAMTFQPPETPPPSLSLVGPALPSARFRETEFWAQGLSVGVSLTY